MTRNNLPVIIAAILAVLIIAVVGIYFVPMAKDVIKELATLTTGGLLAIMRPTSQQVG
jgi:hypothetical protein